jgi:hypothetical protein
VGFRLFSCSTLVGFRSSCWPDLLAFERYDVHSIDVTKWDAPSKRALSKHRRISFSLNDVVEMILSR